jgi:hypothetical protein
MCRFADEEVKVGFWFFLAALMGPRFFARFALLFMLAMGFLLYCVIRS